MAKREKNVYRGMYECEDCCGVPNIEQDDAGYYSVVCADCGRETKYRSASMEAVIGTWNNNLTEKAA